MKLSREAKAHLEAKFNNELASAQDILDLKLKYEPNSLLFPRDHPDRIRAKIAFVERIITARVFLYIEAYKSDGQVIDQNEYDELMQEFDNLVQSHINLIANEYNNPYSGLSPDEEKAYGKELETGYKSALDIAERELELAMSEMRVKEREKFRSLLLRGLYAASRGNTNMALDFYDITQDYGINDKEAQEYFQYFEGKDIIRREGQGGIITITDRCITIAEELIKRSPDEGVIAPSTKDHLGYEDRDFSFIADSDLRKIIERDYRELQKLDSSIAPKSVLILSGSIIEGWGGPVSADSSVA